MSNRRRVEPPPLPAQPNLSAFVRGEKPEEKKPEKKDKDREPTFVVTVRVPKRLKGPLRARLTEEEEATGAKATLQSIAARFFEDWTRKERFPASDGPERGSI